MLTSNVENGEEMKMRYCKYTEYIHINSRKDGLYIRKNMY